MEVVSMKSNSLFLIYRAITIAQIRKEFDILYKKQRAEKIIAERNNVLIECGAYNWLYGGAFND